MDQLINYFRTVTMASVPLVNVDRHNSKDSSRYEVTCSVPNLDLAEIGCKVETVGWECSPLKRDF